MNQWLPPTINALVLLVGLMVTILFSCAPSLPTVPSPEYQTIQFGASMNTPWLPLNDGVMGGLSEGTVSLNDSSMSWIGQTRLQNNGGFASVRAPWGNTNLRTMDRVIIRCRGNGGPFKLTLETSQRWWMPYAYAAFNATEEWQDVVLEDFSWSQAQMGDLKSVNPSRELEKVLRIGLMKYDGTAQAFDLEVASIQFVPTTRH